MSSKDTDKAKLGTPLDAAADARGGAEELDLGDDTIELGSIRMAGASGEVEELRRERDELKDRLLRAHADYQNLARRANQNVADARQLQLMDVARSLLTVLDHFDHALLVDASKINAEDLLKGVHIVRDNLLQTLEGFGIKRMNVEPGEEFNPNRHEALMRQPVEGVASNHIAAELQTGYTIGERTLRPAKVSVTE